MMAAEFIPKLKALRMKGSVFALILLMAMTLAPYHASAANPQPQSMVINWDSQAADTHYKVTIRTSPLNASGFQDISTAYVTDSTYEFSLVNGTEYTVSVQSLTAYGVCSAMSEDLVFTFHNGAVAEKIPTDVDTSPVGFDLVANYPNPFNPSTTISYSVASDANVRLTIYNAIGQRVAELQDGHQSAGSYQVVWQAEGMPSGVYFSVLESGSARVTNKMMLLK